MKELAAYLLLVLSGATPSGDKVKEVLSSVGIEASDEELTRLTTSLEGKDLDTIIAVRACLRLYCFVCAACARLYLSRLCSLTWPIETLRTMTAHYVTPDSLSLAPFN